MGFWSLSWIFLFLHIIVCKKTNITSNDQSRHSYSVEYQEDAPSYSYQVYLEGESMWISSPIPVCLFSGLHVLYTCMFIFWTSSPIYVYVYFLDFLSYIRVCLFSGLPLLYTCMFIFWTSSPIYVYVYSLDFLSYIRVCLFSGFHLLYTCMFIFWTVMFLRIMSLRLFIFQICAFKKKKKNPS
jgi:hypothetical protein